MASFDVVNKLEMPEVMNALEQAKKEIAQRYDFKGTNTTMVLDEKAKTLTLQSASDNRIDAARDVLETRLVKRNVSLKCLDRQKIEPAPGGTSRQVLKLRDGIDDVNAKKIVKMLKDGFPKVQASINGNLVRVSSKSKDALQEVIAYLRSLDLEVPLQFINPRD